MMGAGRDPRSRPAATILCGSPHRGSDPYHASQPTGNIQIKYENPRQLVLHVRLRVLPFPLRLLQQMLHSDQIGWKSCSYKVAGGLLLIGQNGAMQFFFSVRRTVKNCRHFSIFLFFGMTLP